MLRIPHIAATIIALSTMPSTADEANQMIEARKCSAIEGAGLRMTCYDAVFKGDGLAILPEAPTPTSASGETPNQEVIDLRTEVQPAAHWQLDQRKSEMTDQSTVHLSTTSLNDVQCSRHEGPTPMFLGIRCLENTTALIIHGDCHMASGFHGYGQVQYRIDDEKMVEKEFSASTNNQSLGLWSGSRSIPMIKSMIGKNRLMVRFTPFNESPVEASFNISEMEAKLGPVRAACGW